MADVVVQAGHCHRRAGATGTHREQEFTWALGRRLRDLLAEHGHVVTLIGADDPVPTSDAFVALHTDGSSNPRRRGASVGYPDAAGARLAAAWKRAHQRHGYPGGFLRDNYTPALRGYYGFRKSRAPVRFLAEHGTTTNRADELWLFSHLEQCAQAHLDAVNSLFPPPIDPEDDDMKLSDEDVERIGRRVADFVAAGAPAENGTAHLRRLLVRVLEELAALPAKVAAAVKAQP